MQLQNLLLCHECDLLHDRPLLEDGSAALCHRCGALLLERKSPSIDAALALTLASMVFFVLANSFPIMTLNLGGLEQDNRLISGVIVLFQQEMWPLAILVFATSILFPIVRMAGLLYVLLPLKFGRRMAHTGQVFRWVLHIGSWSMLEIYMLGILVALTKLGSIASLVLGSAFYAFIALILTTSAVASALDTHEVWGRLSVD